MTLKEYIVHWQEVYDKKQSRPTTYAAHGYLFKNHILPGLGNIPLEELTAENRSEIFWRRENTLAVTARRALNIQGWENTPCGTSTDCSSSAWTERSKTA